MVPGTTTASDVMIYNENGSTNELNAAQGSGMGLWLNLNEQTCEAPKPTFTTEFCHPTKTGPVYEPPATEWERCLNDPSGSCPYGCTLSYGKELFPEYG